MGQHVPLGQQAAVFLRVLACGLKLWPGGEPPALPPSPPASPDGLGDLISTQAANSDFQGHRVALIY